MKLNRLIDYIVCGLFIYFAWLQINDPDGWIWFLIYISVSIMALYHQSFSPILAKAITFLLGISLLLYIPNVVQWIQTGMPSITKSMSSDTPMTELVREAGGLLICFFILLLYTKKMYKL